MKKYIVCILILLLSLTLISCSAQQAKYWGIIYNSNDGTCSIADKYLDFYINGKYFASIKSGFNLMVQLKEGQHVFKVLLTETQEVLYDNFILDITNNGWWFRYGCNDGTYPRD